MGAPRKADWREERRKRAWQLKEQGWQQKDIATVLGGSEGSVSQWLKRGREQGVEALPAHPPKGVTPRARWELTICHSHYKLRRAVPAPASSPGPPLRRPQGYYKLRRAVLAPATTARLFLGSNRHLITSSDEPFPLPQLDEGVE